MPAAAAGLLSTDSIALELEQIPVVMRADGSRELQSNSLW
jgi:hypothetical protein